MTIQLPHPPTFKSVPKLTDWGNYRVHVSWAYLKEALAEYKKNYNFDFGDSDFQRAHVWTEEQQVAYVEYRLRGGISGGDILTNCTGWNGNMDGQMVLVDGKQRLNAVLRFLNNEIKAFGYFRKEYGDRLSSGSGPNFYWHVNDLPDHKAVLRWYLEINAGGTVHTADEIEKVRKLLATI